MKKYLLLLPLAGLLLTGCKGDETEENKPIDSNLPAGGQEVDIKSEEQVTRAVEKLADDIKNSYVSVMGGFEINGSFKADELSIVEGDMTVKGIDLAYNFSLKANNLDKKLSEWQVAVEVTDFGGKVVLNEANPETKKMFEASNISFSVYLSQGVVYADLSNPALVNLVNSVLNYAVPASNLESVHLVVDPLMGKVKIIDLISALEIPDEKIIPTVTDEMFAELKTEIKEGIEELLEEESSPISFVDYKDNGLGLLIQYGDSEENMHENEYGSYKIKEDTFITGSVYFSEAGNLEKINISETLDNEYIENNVVVEKEKISATESIAFKYGTGNVVMPDFSTYVDAHFEELMASIFESITEMPMFGVSVDEHNLML